MPASIKFTTHPGAFERHLQRKYNNPLFPQADQHPLAAEIEQARQKDRQDQQAFLTAFEQSVQQAAQLSGSVDAEVILELKQELERLYVHSCSLAGDLDQHRQAIVKLIHICMSTIEKGASDDMAALQKLRDENSAREVFFTLLETKLVADLIRGDEIISATELIPSLLSISPQQVPQVMELFDTDQIAEIFEQANHFIASLPEQVVTVSGCQKQLAAIEACR